MQPLVQLKRDCRRNHLFQLLRPILEDQCLNLIQDKPPIVSLNHIQVEYTNTDHSNQTNKLSS